MQTQSNEGLSPTFQTIIDCFPGDVLKFNSELEIIASNQTFRDLALYKAKCNDCGSCGPEQGIAPNEASTNNRPCT
jgi:hypothetical protein